MTVCGFLTISKRCGILIVSSVHPWLFLLNAIFKWTELYFERYAGILFVCLDFYWITIFERGCYWVLRKRHVWRLVFLFWTKYAIRNFGSQLIVEQVEPRRSHLNLAFAFHCLVRFVSVCKSIFSILDLLC